MGVIARKYQDAYQVDVSLVTPFIEALTTVLQTFCNTSVRSKQAEFVDHGAVDNTHLCIGMSLATETTIGNVVIRFPKRVIMGIISKMLGESITEINCLVEDGAKELTNQVFNQAKKLLIEKNISAIRSIPIIICSKEKLSVNYLTMGRSVRLPFFSEWGDFSIEVTTQDVTISDKV